MNRAPPGRSVSSVTVVLGIGAAVALWLLALGRHDYPNLHTILDTGSCLFAGVLALLLWDIGRQTEHALARWLCMAFALTFGSELLHTAVTIEWFGILKGVAGAQPTLRPATWPVAAYILALGVIAAITLSPRYRRVPWAFVLSIFALSVLLLPIFYTFPRYTAPQWLGITRPLLVGVPLLWAGIAWACWRRRAQNRLYPMLWRMACVLLLAHLVMLYSRAPHDTEAMVAHLGKVIGQLVLMLLLMRAATNDMADRVRAQEALERLNAELEGRVAERTLSLQVAYEQTRAIIDTAPDGVIVMDEQGLVTQFNPSAEKIFGHRRDDVLGRSLADTLIPPSMREGHRSGLARHLALGGGRILGQRVELEGLRADGSGVPLELTVNRMPGADNVTFSGFVRDLTDRKRDEAVRAQLAAIVTSSDDAILSMTLVGIVTTWNAGAERLFGYSAQEMIGQPILKLIPPERAEEENDILLRIAEGGRIVHFETERVAKDGHRIDVSITVSPLRDASGTIVGASKIARDITERKQAQGKLATQLARLGLLNQVTQAIGQRQDIASILAVTLRSLEEDLPVDFACVGLYDPLDELLTISRVGVRSASLAAGMDMTAGSQVPIDANGLSRCVAGSLVYEPDIEHVPFSFPQRLARTSLRSLVIAPLLVESRVFGVLIVARHAINGFGSPDCEFLRQLSEHVALAAHQAETHAALQRAYEDLQQTQQAIMQQERLRALGQMASGIAHDINNAVSPVSLYTDLLIEREPTLSEAGRGYLRVIQQAIGDVEQTVARMREFYRQREPALTLAPVALNELAQQVLDLTRARWSDMSQLQGAVITPMLALTASLPSIMGVASEIREALTNLIFNAVDAMPQGGTLTLATGTANEGEDVYIEVRDSGVGMDEETRRRCLEPFFTTKGERGTGLGLAMVYGVVQRHSADIGIDSAPGQGTSVRLSFLRQHSPLQSDPAYPPTQLFAARARLRLLVIDDDPLLLKSLRDILESDGHVIVTARGGREGIEAFEASFSRREPFAAVITDLGMPHVDGRAVARAIKTVSYSTPVILLTGWGQRLVSEGDIPAHVDRVLNKPPKLPLLREALAHLCGPSVEGQS